ncbi:bacterioferritin [Aquisalimonas sp.]|uniref:bacterioferritin n=1 Tax=unclassified Aquisalimonas TaxID=2644645 RepID=UPI0025C1FE7A|nr:bacterioferritin [Aquisalimonas sp.]
MKGDAKVIKFLNKVLYNELTAINQYFLHSRMLNDWGLEKLGASAYDTSIKEMKHADKLIDRILFLEGMPNLQDLGKLLIGEDVKEVLECDLRMEERTCPELRDAIEYAESVEDYVTRDLLAEILADEEEHLDFLETQLDLIERVGLKNYQQSQVWADD